MIRRHTIDGSSSVHTPNLCDAPSCYISATPYSCWLCNTIASIPNPIFHHFICLFHRHLIMMTVFTSSRFKHPGHKREARIEGKIRLTHVWPSHRNLYILYLLPYDFPACFRNVWRLKTKNPITLGARPLTMTHPP